MVGTCGWISLCLELLVCCSISKLKSCCCCVVRATI
uniref:Uncharacterized protein n=1 Tax=Arundo donax TaxID=35708 RepID=A0A0A9HNB0_ARUDO